MQHPYQCIHAVEHIGPEDGRILLAASGPKLFSINFADGKILDAWATEVSSSSAVGDLDPDQLEGPPGKKRKISSTAGPSPRFIKLVSALDGQHIVAVTGEDKCVRVFSLNPSGKLQQLSERCMPKRPCALAITSDSQTIMCGDKFGDVYALPLHHSPEDVQLPPSKSEEAAVKDFVPSASNLTVHTGRNRKALEAQLKQKNQAKAKEPLKFAHEILLGHVSMLTDLALVTLDQEDLKEIDGFAAIPSKPRSYILTSDRDEHIRVSRGQPQAHVIEGFCLGHQEFVSKLCLVTPQILVSGGGDDQLFVWDWLKGRLLNKIPIRDAVASMTDTGNLSDDTKRDFSVAVSGIWGFPKESKKKTRIVISCEGIPGLLDIAVDELQSAAEDIEVTTISVTGNVIDVAVVGSMGMVVSVDNTHVPGSTTDLRADKEGSVRLEWWCYTTEGQWKADSGLEAVNGQGSVEVSKSSEVHDMLYGIGNLRKRDGGGE